MTGTRRRFERRGGSVGPSPIPVVNLLPQSVQTTDRFRLRIRQWAVGLGVGAVVVFSAAIGVRASAYGHTQLQALLHAEEQRVKREERGAAKLAAQAELLRRRCDDLREILAADSWSARLRMLANSTPPGLMLKRIEAAPVRRAAEPGSKAAPVQVFEWRIEGLAERYDAIVRLQEELRERVGFREVSMLRSDARRLGRTNLIEFGFVCRR